MRYLLYIIFISSSILADSLFITEARFPKTGDLIAFSLPTNKGRAHFVLKRINDEEWRGKVNRKYKVSGTSDGETFFLYYKLKNRHFFSKIENGVAKVYSRAKLNKSCSFAGLAKASLGATLAKQIKVSVIVEKKVQDQIGSKVALWVRSMFNSSKDHYEELGLSLLLQEIILINRNFNSSNIDNLLEEIRGTRPEFGFATSSDVVHLIFGTAIEPDDTIGLAYLATVCQFKKYRFGVSRLVSRSLQPVLFSHEVGHNLGANHSSSGIMRAVLNSPDVQFSSESILEVQDYVSEFGECLKSQVTPNLLRLTSSGNRIILRHDTPACRVSILSTASKDEQFVKGQELKLRSSRISGVGKVRFKIKSKASNSGKIQALLNCSGSKFRSKAVKVAGQALSIDRP